MGDPVEPWRHVVALLTLHRDFDGDERDAAQVRYVSSLDRREMGGLVFALGSALGRRMEDSDELDRFIETLTRLADTYELGGGLPDT